MEDKKKTKPQLIAELAELRQRVTELEHEGPERLPVEQAGNQVEEAKRESEERFRYLFENAPVSYQSLDGNGNLIECNTAWCETLGYAKEEVLGRNFSEFLHPDYLEAFKENFQKFKSFGHISCAEFQMIQKDGSPILVSFEGRIGQGKDGSFKQTHCVFHDITKRKRAEEKLGEEHERAQTYLDLACVMFVALDTSGTVSLVNRKAREVLGYTDEEIVGSNWFDLCVPQRLREQVTEVAKQLLLGEIEAVEYYENPVVTKSGEERLIAWHNTVLLDAQGSITGHISSGTDITERRRSEEEKAALEAQLRHAQKMETIGTLAGGIAHDFNNILAPILGYTDMALHRLEPKDPLVEDLRNVLNAAHRAEALVQQILLFSKQTENERKPLRLQGIVTDALKLLRPTIPTTVDIQWHADDSCGSVLADTTQMHQVVVNMCTNAWQSMWENGGGTVTIELAQTSVNADTARLHPDLTEQEYACLSVNDSGCGMDEEIRARIFEPFFTTKAIDEGTGLGLSVVHGIVRSHNGAILLDSELGKGTTIRVYLPTVSAELEVSKRESKAFVGGRESIMVVDDEPSIANLLRMMLGSCGYEVDAYTSSVEALQAFRRQPDKYDLLISDLTMPNMTGLELSDQVHEGHPELPVMIMTGFGDGLMVDTQKKYGIKQVVKKPAMLADLAAAVREILDG